MNSSDPGRQACSACHGDGCDLFVGSPGGDRWGFCGMFPTKFYLKSGPGGRLERRCDSHWIPAGPDPGGWKEVSWEEFAVLEVMHG